MKKEFNIGEIKGFLDTDYYNGGITLKDTNGYTVKVSREGVELLSRICNLIPYREDVINYLKEEGLDERVFNEPYIEEVTKNYEEHIFNDSVKPDYRIWLKVAVAETLYDDFKPDKTETTIKNVSKDNFLSEGKKKKKR